jgi:outer membrane protein
MKNVLPHRILKSMALLTMGFLALSSAQASGINEPPTDVLSTPGSVGLGAITQIEASPYKGTGTRGDLLPLYLYEGERVFLHSGRAGLKLLDSPEHRLDFFLDKRLEGFQANKIPASVAGMAMRSSSTDVGLAYSYRQSWGTLQAELLFDAANTSKGSEARLGYSYEWRSGPWTLRPAVSLSMRDAKLNNYYYGVLPGEATATRAAYAPGAGVNALAGLYGTYALTQRWQLLGGVSATVLSGGIRNSPVVQKRVLPAIYVGASYDFGGQKREAAEASSPTWFKLMYGQATEDGCHLAKIITARCLSTASTNATSIAGLQVGKTVAQGFNGWPVDVVAYAGLLQHNDRGLQPNGAQLDLFVKAFYTGFPWSDRVKTRLGLGAGVSLAQRVPYTEAPNAATGPKPASRILQSLDPTIDVSVGDLLGYRALKETYFGFGVSHRSGIFSSSRLLGNVNGGSNYIYTYIESAL